MDRVKMWRGIALGMTLLALTSIAVTLAGAGPLWQVAPTPPDQVDSRQYEWRGVIYRSDLEGGFWALKTACGGWALNTSDMSLLEKIKKNEMMEVDVWGTVFNGAGIVQMQTITANAVFGKDDPKPMTLVAVPDYCATHGVPPKGTAEPTKSTPVYPPYFQGNSFGQVLGNVLQRIAGGQMGKVDPDTQFDHFASVQVTVLDKNGKEVVVNAVAGVATSNDGKTLVIDPNGAAGQTKYTLDGVKVIRTGGGTAGDIKVGDKIVVVTQDGKPMVVIASRQVTVWPDSGPQPRPLPMSGRDDGSAPAASDLRK